eukprot:463286-Amphidinium_carterae.1
MEKVGEVPEVQQMSKSVALDNVMKELQLQASKVVTKQAPPLFKGMVMAMERLVVDEESSPYIRGYAWYKLLQ